MAITRDALRDELKATRVGATAFTDAQLDSYLDTAIMGLYPVYFKQYVDTTTAAGSAIETMPTGCRNLHEVILLTTRPRHLRGWAEGDGDAFIPALAIGDGTTAGSTLVWHWTDGWDAPANGSASIDIPYEAKEFVLLKAHLFCLQQILTARLETDKFFAVQVRQAISEDEILATIDSLQRELDAKVAQAAPLPKVEK